MNESEDQQHGKFLSCSSRCEVQLHAGQVLDVMVKMVIRLNDMLQVLEALQVWKKERGRLATCFRRAMPLLISSLANQLTPSGVIGLSGSYVEPTREDDSVNNNRKYYIGMLCEG